MTTDGDNDFISISSLAVDPGGNRIAVHGQNPTASSPSSSYVFVLDAASGAQVSALLKMTFSAGVAWRVGNDASLMQSDGTVIFTADQIGPASGVAEPWRLHSWNSLTNSISYAHKTPSDFLGRAQSLIRGVGTFSNHLYLGGSLADSSGGNWHLGLIHVSDATNPQTSSTASRLVYSIGDCSNVALQYGYTSGLDSAPMISHMAAMDDANGAQVFGLTNSHNQNGAGDTQFSIVWRVEIDSVTGDAKTDSTKFKNK